MMILISYSPRDHQPRLRASGVALPTSMTSWGAELIGERFAVRLSSSALVRAADFFTFFVDDFRARVFVAVPLPASSDLASSVSVWLFTLGLRLMADFLACAFIVLEPSDGSLSAVADVLVDFFAAFLRVVLPADWLFFMVTPSLELEVSATASCDGLSLAFVD